MAKRKPNKRKKPNKKVSNIKLINLVLAMTILTLSVTMLAYYTILKENEKKHTTIKKPSPKNDDSLEDYRVNRINKYFEKYSREDTYEVYTEELKKEYVPKKEIKETIQTPENETKPQIITSNKPKLAIIIDDVTLQSQVDKINNIGYDITMSFMPPTPRHKNSARIAQVIPVHMIHFPLQATSFKFEEENTLHVGDSYEKIEKRVQEVREYYPNAIYTNNHTGSKFTSDDESMDRLFKALKKYNFIFVDSRTTGKSVAKKYALKYDMPYIVRNIFLDNEKDFTYIQNQLKKAIKRAKKSGYAIAIGHPYSITIKVLNESKDLLTDIDLVLINQIPTH